MLLTRLRRMIPIRRMIPSQGEELEESFICECVEEIAVYLGNLTYRDKVMSVLFDIGFAHDNKRYIFWVMTFIDKGGLGEHYWAHFISGVDEYRKVGIINYLIRHGRFALLEKWIECVPVLAQYCGFVSLAGQYSKQIEETDKFLKFLKRYHDHSEHMWFEGKIPFENVSFGDSDLLFFIEKKRITS